MSKMKLEQSKFLGITKNRFHSKSYDISLVDYHTPVSEDWHYHENTHLSLILQGGNRESRKNEDIQVTTGKIMFYNAGETHRNQHTAFPSKNLNIEYKKEFFNKNKLDPKIISKPSIQNIDAYLNLLNIYNELHLVDLYTVDNIEFSLNQLLESNDTSSYIPVWIKQMKEIIEDRWDEFIPLKDLATTFNVHPVTISKYFRKYYQCTLGDYMRKIKIDKAIFFLLNTKTPISEISDICGFTDQSHMIKVFKAYIGFLPNQIRLL